MITFILPGYSLKNKEWLEKTSNELKIDGIIRPIFWDHWEDPEEKFNVIEKANLVIKIANRYETNPHEAGATPGVNIIAKSVGSLVASYAIEKEFDQVNRVIFCGIPMNDLNDEEKATIKKVLVSISPEKIICFQNENDPHGSFAQVSEFLPVGIKLINKPRSDHEYPYYDEFQKFLAS